MATIRTARNVYADEDQAKLNSYYLGVKNTERTTVDGLAPVEVVITSPTKLITQKSSDSTLKTGDGIVSDFKIGSKKIGSEKIAGVSKSGFDASGLKSPLFDGETVLGRKRQEKEKIKKIQKLLDEKEGKEDNKGGDKNK